MVFPGFPAEAISFFRALTRNNDRDWFKPRKEIYETQVKAPMMALVEAMNSEFAKLAPEYINDPKKAIYRIYRDTRFSSDKTPYKTHIAAVFPRRGRVSISPGSGGQGAGANGFYFSISAKEIGIAGGVYQPQPDQLLAIRTWLAQNHAEFRKAIRPAEKIMGKLEGQSLQRIPKGFHPDHPASDLLKMKQWVFWETMDAKIATTPRLQAEFLKRFRALLPAMELLNQALPAAKAVANVHFR